MNKFLRFFNGQIITNNPVIYTNRNPSLSDSYNLKKVHFMVVTFSKTGTSSLSEYLSKVKSKIRKGFLINTVHCHSEECWRVNFDFMKDIDFNLNDIINFNIRKNRKTLVFQLYREPIGRLISHYFHINRNCSDISNKNLINFIKDNIYLDTHYYEDKFNYSYKDNKIFDKKKKIGIKYNNGYDVIFCCLEHLDQLKKFLIDKYSDKYTFPNEDIGLYNINSTSTKEITSLINNIEIPRDLFEEVFKVNKTILEFYYTQNDIEKIKKDYYNGDTKYKLKLI